MTSDPAEAHPEYSLIFQALAVRGVRFCLLRDDLDVEKLSGDLDLLVDDERFDEVLTVLDSLGYRVKTTERSIAFKTALVKYANGSFVVIDLHRRIVQNGIVFHRHNDVLDRRRPVGDYWMPSDPDLLVILLFHNVLGKRRIQDKHYPEVCRLIQCCDREALQAVVPGSATRRVLFALIQDIDQYRKEPERVEQVRLDLVRSLRTLEPGQRRRAMVRKIRHGLRRYDPRPRGRLYALLGVDGSGKSSLSKALIESLSSAGGFPVVPIYMGPWGSYLVKGMGGAPYVPGWSLTGSQWLQAILRRRGTEKPALRDVLRITLKTLSGRKIAQQDRSVHRRVREQSRFYLTLRYLRSQVATARFFVMLTIEMLVRYGKVYRSLRRRRIVIADRYIYDLMTGGMHEVIPHYHRIRSLMCRLFFRPDRVFLLHNDAEAILARKKDLSREVLLGFQDIYDRLAERYAFEVITTDRPPDELARAIIERHFDELIDSVRT